jgi:hypothetical protein
LLVLAPPPPPQFLAVSARAKRELKRLKITAEERVLSYDWRRDRMKPQVYAIAH